MLMACIGVSAQTQTVTGTVTDANHEPMIGVSIMEKGSTNGTATDVDGKFSIKVSPKATIKVSYIGYVTQEIAVDGRSQINVVMDEDNVQLDEVVVVGARAMSPEPCRQSPPMISRASPPSMPVPLSRARPQACRS